MKKLIAALAGLAVFAPTAMASSHFLKVSPGQVAAGKTVTVSGSVGSGCHVGRTGDVATVFSKAFKGATKQNLAGVPSVSVSLAQSTNGAFSTKVKLSTNVKAGKYSVGGRCGGGNFGTTTLKVKPANNNSNLPGAY